MKNYAKFLVLCVLLACFSTTANAQSARKFSVGLTSGYGTSKYGSGFVIGGDLRYEFGKGNHWSVPVTIGFTSILNKATTYAGKKYKSDSYNYLPIRAGIKYSINKESFGYYGLAEIGVYNKLYIGGGETNLIYSPAIGYAFKNRLDVAVKYEGFWTGINWKGYEGVRVAYAF